MVKAKATPVKAAAGKQQQSIIDSKRAYNINILMGSKIKIPVRCLKMPAAGGGAAGPPRA